MVFILRTFSKAVQQAKTVFKTTKKPLLRLENQFCFLRDLHKAGIIFDTFANH